MLAILVLGRLKRNMVRGLAVCFLPPTEVGGMVWRRREEQIGVSAKLVHAYVIDAT
jgi:hypothetical protein